MSESHTPESIWDDPRITAYVLGDMTGDERAEFEKVIESSAEMAAAVEEARAVTGQLESLYADEPTKGLDANRRKTIVAPDVEALVTNQPRSWKIPALVLATAAALLLMIGVAPWLQQEREMTVTQVEMAGQTAANSESASQPRFDDDTLTARPMEESEEDREEEMGGKGLGGSLANQQGAHKNAPAGRSLATPDSDRNRGNQSSDQYARSQPQFTAPREAASSKQPASKDRKSGKLALSAEKKQDLGGDDSGVSSDPPVAMVPENGTIIARGSRRDVAAVKEVIEDMEWTQDESVRLESLSKLESRLSRAAPAPVQLQQAEGQRRVSSKAFNSPTAPTNALARGRYSNREGQISQKRIADTPGFAAGADYAAPIDEGRGPGIAGDRFEPITDNPFKRVAEHPLSTFSVDVDTASYSKVRDFLMRANQLPRPDAVRIEELLNYFDYDYPPPSAEDKHPFAARVAVTSCPWNDNHRLARIALKGKTMDKDERPPCNLVFLLDTSGSMNAPNKLPLVIEGMQMLLNQLNENDKVAITVYAGSAGLVLDSTSAKKTKKIRRALTQLAAGGSTNGGAGIALAYQTARDHFIPEGVNRVILCTDGDFNVGTTGTDELVRMVENEAKGGVFLSVLGFGMGNHNDAMLEKISGRGNGNYAFIDTHQEARKVLVQQTSGTLVTIAKDVKLQIEFNPSQVSSYRLIGYENRVLAKEDFNDDKKDAGEIGAGHAVTALYEIVPAGIEPDAGRTKVDDLKYQGKAAPTPAADSNEMMTLKLRYKQPDGDTSTLVEFPVADEDGNFEDADDDVRFAAAVASFGMQLRRSEYAGNWTMSDAMNVANRAKGDDRFGLRAEFVELVQKASLLMGEE